MNTPQHRLPSLTISTSTSCASSVHTTDSPYYCYSSPTTIPRSQSVHVQRRTYSPPQRSASAGSTLNNRYPETRWDELALELADDLPLKPMSSRDTIKTKLRQWVSKKSSQRSLFNKWST
ncbi:hypothetical protein BC941DRAFT_468286 [Chlamydoabsidia padenii]|nr:hypothetical protein BC941DRAFT_468286 [Chlamydoabsidia padenii]